MTSQETNLSVLDPGTPPSKPRKSRVIQILLTIACGVVLAIGSCFGFIATLNINGPDKPLNAAFVIGMAGGAVLFVGGVIWGVVAIIVHLFSHRQEGL